MDDFKTRLDFYMRKRGFNPTSLARTAQLSATTVRDILAHKGTPNPRIDTFSMLCYALNVSPYHLSPDFEKLYSPQQLRLLGCDQIQGFLVSKPVPFDEMTRLLRAGRERVIGTPSVSEKSRGS